MPSYSPDAGIVSLDRWSRWLLFYARCRFSLPGRKSAFRKFRRRQRGKPFRALTRGGFWLEGHIGDSVENQVAVFGEFEPGLSRFITSIAPQTTTFVDIGCNIGYFSCLYGIRRPEGRILAIDANPAIIEQCRRNLGLNRIRANTVNAAIGESKRRVILRVPRGRPSRATLGSLPQGSAGQTEIEVEMNTLESILEQHHLTEVDLIKVDIEGYELRLFRSLSREVAARLRLIVFEFAEANLNQCGCTKQEFASVPWFDLFQLYSLDEPTGDVRQLGSLAEFTPPEGTIILQNKHDPLRLAFK